MIFRLLCAVAAVGFAAAAVAQWNDAEHFRWLGLYACAALVSGATAVARVRLGSGPPIALGVGALAVAAWMAPRVLEASSYTWNQEERDLAGLTVVGLWMLFIARRQGRRA